MSEGKLRVGIIGAGYISAVHSAAYRAAAGTFAEVPREVELAAVSDLNASQAQRLSREWGWERTEPEWQRITRAEDIDLVDVSVPNSLHAQIAIDALEHGKHVICEKPLAHDLSSARAMCAAAERSERLAQVCFYYRLWPAIAWAKQLVEDGRIGEVQHFRGWMLQDYAADPRHTMGWRSTRADAGAGALGDLGSHILDIARYLCGEVRAVNAITRQLVERSSGSAELDDAAVIMLEFSTGASAVVEASWAMRGHRCDLGFDLVGRDGAVRFSWERANEIEVFTGDVDSEKSGFQRVLIGPGQPGAGGFAGVPGQGLGYRDAFTIGIGRALAAAAVDAGSAAPSFEDGLRVAELTDATLRSAESRSWISIR